MCSWLPFIPLILHNSNCFKAFATSIIIISESVSVDCFFLYGSWIKIFCFSSFLVVFPYYWILWVVWLLFNKVSCYLVVVLCPVSVESCSVPAQLNVLPKMPMQISEASSLYSSLWYPAPWILVFRVVSNSDNVLRSVRLSGSVWVLSPYSTVWKMPLGRKEDFGIYLVFLLRPQSYVGSNPQLKIVILYLLVLCLVEHDLVSVIPIHLEPRVSECMVPVFSTWDFLKSISNNLFCFNYILFCFTVSIVQCLNLTANKR